MSYIGFCQTKRTWSFLSELMHSPLFVKLNAFDDFGGGAFTFSIFNVKKLVNWQVKRTFAILNARYL